MESKDKLKETYIKNRAPNYFDEIIKIEDFDPVNILIDEKSYENILVYNISYKSLIDSMPSRIRLWWNYIFSFIWKWKIWFHFQQDEMVLQI